MSPAAGEAGAPAPPRLAPLLSGTSAGSLGAADIEEIGISIVALDVLELLLAVGWDRVRTAGGASGFLGWDGDITAVARFADATPGPGGWRGRQLPQLLRRRDGVLRLRSAVDGRVADISVEELRTAADELGATAAPELGERSAPPWDMGAPIPGGSVVTDLAAREAAAGRYLGDARWCEVASAGPGPLVEGCGCRACTIASGTYLAHLCVCREITGEHLLGWHNLHQLRLLVEAEGAPA